MNHRNEILIGLVLDFPETACFCFPSWSGELELLVMSRMFDNLMEVLP